MDAYLKIINYVTGLDIIFPLYLSLTIILHKVRHLRTRIVITIVLLVYERG